MCVCVCAHVSVSVYVHVCVSVSVCVCVHSLIGVYESIYFELLSDLSLVGLSSVSICSGAMIVIAIKKIKKGGEGGFQKFSAPICAPARPQHLQLMSAWLTFMYKKAEMGV